MITLAQETAIGERPARGKIITVVHGRDLVHHFDRQAFSERQIQPASLDVITNRFTRRDGTSCNFPFAIQPGEEVVAHSNLLYRGSEVETRDYIESNIRLCVDTRSRYAARLGLTVMGFHNPDDGTIIPNATPNTTLEFVLQNHDDSPLLISGPISPGQLWEIQETTPLDIHNTEIHVYDDEADVTEQRKIRIDGNTGYIVHLGNSFCYFQRKNKPENIEQKRRSGRLTTDLPIQQLITIGKDDNDVGFCLTSTKERIVTNGYAVYMVPFHYLDLRETGMLNNISGWHNFFLQACTDTRYTTATLNAGIHNPGCDGTIVFESIIRGRNLEKYFKPGEPFGVIIPIPFYDGSTDNHSYGKQTGSLRRQNGVTLE